MIYYDFGKYMFSTRNTWIIENNYMDLRPEGHILATTALVFFFSKTILK